LRTQAVSFGAFSTLLQKVRVEIGHVKHGEHEDACTSVKESERDIFKERERELTGTQKKTRRIKREHKESIKRERERERERERDRETEREGRITGPCELNPVSFFAFTK
jgi:hypothetical protein